jgi:hypothetical protein
MIGPFRQFLGGMIGFGGLWKTGPVRGFTFGRDGVATGGGFTSGARGTADTAAEDGPLCPAAATARTVKLYDVPCASPSKTACVPVTVFVLGPVTSYFAAPATDDHVTCTPPGTE